MTYSVVLPAMLAILGLPSTAVAGTIVIDDPFISPVVYDQSILTVPDAFGTGSSDEQVEEFFFFELPDDIEVARAEIRLDIRIEGSSFGYSDPATGFGGGAPGIEFETFLGVLVQAVTIDPDSPPFGPDTLVLQTFYEEDASAGGTGTISPDTGFSETILFDVASPVSLSAPLNVDAFDFLIENEFLEVRAEFSFFDFIAVSDLEAYTDEFALSTYVDSQAFASVSASLAVTPVPLPGSGLALLGGLGALVAGRRLLR